MKRKICIGVAAFHLLFIIVSNMYNSYNTYCDYYNKPINNLLSKYANACLNNKAISQYARYTGTSTGYGFFAPNVKSPTVLSCKYQGNEIVPAFGSNEGQLRYGNLIGALIENINLKKMPSNEQEKQIFATRRKYNELVCRNIAVKLMNECQLPPDDINMQLSFVKQPSLQDARQGKTTSQGLLSVQLLKFNMNNEKGNN
jgi:hypothetical protein